MLHRDSIVYVYLHLPMGAKSCKRKKTNIGNFQMALTFNRKLFPNNELESTTQSSLAAKFETDKPIPLKYTWSLWEQLQQNQPANIPAEQAAPAANQSANYGDLTRKVVSISDIQSFWRYFAHLPQPSSILGESMKVIRKEVGEETGHTLAALMLFKEDIRPEWEDDANKNGGHFQFTLQLERSRSTKEGGQVSGKDNWLAQTDEYWNNLVLGLIGGTLDSDDFVTGIRLVDKVKLPVKPGARPVGHIRVEIWFRNAKDTAKITALEEAVEAHLRCKLDGTMAPDVFPGYRLDMRSHEEGVAGEGVAHSKPTAPRTKRFNESGKATSGGFRRFGGRKGSNDESPNEKPRQ